MTSQGNLAAKTGHRLWLLLSRTQSITELAALDPRLSLCWRAGSKVQHTSQGTWGPGRELYLM